MHHMNLNHPFKQSLLSCAIALAVTACGSGGGGDSGAAEQSKGGDNGNIDQLLHRADVVNSLGILFGEQLTLPRAVIKKPEGASMQAATEAEQDGPTVMMDEVAEAETVTTIDCSGGGTVAIISFDRDKSLNPISYSKLRAEYNQCKEGLFVMNGVGILTDYAYQNAQMQVVNVVKSENEQRSVAAGDSTEIIDGQLTIQKTQTFLPKFEGVLTDQEFGFWQSYSVRIDYNDPQKEDTLRRYDDITLMTNYEYIDGQSVMSSALSTLDGNGAFTYGNKTVDFTIKTTVPFGFIGSNYQGEFDIMLNGSRVRMVCDNSPNATLFVDINNDGIDDYTFINSLDGFGLRDI